MTSSRVTSNAVILFFMVFSPLVCMYIMALARSINDLNGYASDAATA